MLQYNPSISGSLSVTGSLIVTNGVIGTVNGVDIQIFSSSISQVVTNIQTATGSQDGRLTSIESFTSSVSTTNTFTASASARLGSIETVSASNLSRIGSLETISASNIARINSLETTSASVDTLNTTQNNRLTSLEVTTGSLATTGSNTFIGTQTITGSLFISANLVVQGTSSLQNITASAVSIGTNIVNLNTANPAIRYAGLVIGDSGSVGGSGSFLYDSVQDEMIFVHRGTSTVVTSSVVLMGPQTFDTLGTETYPTANRIQKGTGNEHLVDSCIFDDGTTVCVNANLRGSSVISGTSLRSTGVGTFGFNTVNNGEFQIYGTALDGMIMAGRGSSNDMVITNKNGSDVFRIPTGTIIANFIGNVCAPSFVLANGNCITALRNTGGAAIGVLGFASGTDTLFIKGGTSGAAASIQFQDTAGTMATFFNCRLGIGTTTPGTALEVLSRAADADRTIPHNVLTITAEQGNAPYGFFGGSILFKNRSYASGLVESSRIRSVIYDDGAPANCGGGIWFETTRTPGGTLTPSLVINYAGNVGIGTCTPTYKLHIFAADCFCNGEHFMGGYGISDGSVTIGYNANGTVETHGFIRSRHGVDLGLGAGTNTQLYLKQGGNVGIGTSTPYTTLEVLGGNQCPPSTGTQNYTMALRDPTSMVCGVGGSILFQGYKTGTAAIGNFAYIAGKKENGTAGNEAGYISLGNFDSAGNVGERMRISSASCGGVVRIGTCAINWNTNSNVILQVAGAIRFGNPDGDYVPSYGGGISARTLSNFAPGSFAIVVKGLGGSGFLYQVQGFTSAGVRFTDLLFGVNNTFSVIASQNENGPAARAYTITSENLNICIGGSATYSAIVAHGFGAVER